MKIVAGVDLGATKVRYVTAEAESGRILHRREVDGGPFCKQSGRRDRHLRILDAYRKDLPLVERLHTYLDEGLSGFLAEKNVAAGDIMGIGISLPGKIIQAGDKGYTLFMGANTPVRFVGRLDDGRVGINATKTLRKRFPHTKITCDNDCKAIGRAQAMVYEAMGIDPKATLYVTISTGIGGGGARNDVDEDGHMPVANLHPSISLKCDCGALDCIEALASGQGMANLAARVMELHRKKPRTFREFENYEKMGGRLPREKDLGKMVDKTSLQEKYKKKQLTSKDLCEAMKKGDDFAVYLLDTTARMTAGIFAGLAQIHGLGRIGVGGGVGINQPHYIALIQKHVRSMLAGNKLLPNGLVVEISPLGKFAGDYGALILAMPEKHKKEWAKTMTKP